MDQNKSDTQLWEVAKKIDFDYRIIGFVVLLIFLLTLLTIKFSDNENFMRGNDIFSKGFTVINFVLIIYVIYINIQYNSSNDERANRQESYKISKYLWSDTMNEMIKYFPETYIFYNQVDQFDKRSEGEILADLKPNPSKMKQLNYFFSNIIIQNLEDFTNLKKYLTTADHISWLTTFYYMFQSKILQENWEKVKSTFSQNTSNVIQQFVDIGKEENLTEDEIIEKLKQVKLST
jgi:hypothetical protein